MEIGIVERSGLCGVAVGNATLDAPFPLTDDPRARHEGRALWKPPAPLDAFAPQAGAVSLALPTMNNAAWRTLKREGGAALTGCGLRVGSEMTTPLAAKMAVLGVIASVGLTMFPLIPASSIDPHASPTVRDASSSHLTLFVMLVGAAIFMPPVLPHATAIGRAPSGRVTERDGVGNGRALYGERTVAMWCSAWALGRPLAAPFAVVAAMGREMREDAAMAAASERGAPRHGRR